MSYCLKCQVFFKFETNYSNFIEAIEYKGWEIRVRNKNLFTQFNIRFGQGNYCRCKCFYFGGHGRQIADWQRSILALLIHMKYTFSGNGNAINIHTVTILTSCYAINIHIVTLLTPKDVTLLTRIWTNGVESRVFDR